MMKHFNKFAVNFLFFITMCVLFFSSKPMPNGFLGVVAGILLLNALCWSDIE
jgi:hypothetical protein